MKYSVAHYSHALANLLQGKKNQEVANILPHVYEHMRKNGDEKLFPTVLRSVIKELTGAKIRRTARIVSAFTLDEKEKQMLRDSFTAETYEFEVNKNILGGIVIQRGTSLYNYTFSHTIGGIAKTS